MSALERDLEITAGWDDIVGTCAHEPKGDHGRHGVTMRWLVKGEKGAVQFVLYTNWMLDVTWADPEYQDYMRENVVRPDFMIMGSVGLITPMPADLGYHWITQRYKGQTSMKCEYVPTGKCYYDGSGLNAEIPWKILREQGGEALWAYLEDYYEGLI